MPGVAEPGRGRGIGHDEPHGRPARVHQDLPCGSVCWRERGPQLDDVTVRHRSAFAYATGHLPDGTTMPLFRLRYNGSATTWGFAIYCDSYENSCLPSGHPSGTLQEALDCACGLYLNDHTTWLQPDELTGATTSPLLSC
ncbi:hypothetical protein GCM10011609_86810 [Lentzea pudingi]|uniref:Uncharacterized protein n=1 Tax=Lentzea pudingi TaxID=1789439 RepID=A0ABQ2IVM7_9PSEU|nr:hypothetical protein GCM10011609_86810 [Lentzea pudingi]